MTSAFAEAAAKGSPPATGQSNPLPFNTDSPFARPSDFKGGDFTPTPPYEAIIGRTVVYIPRTFDPAAPNPLSNEPGATRKQWTVDFYVIDGGRLSFWRKQKGDPTATPPTTDKMVEHIVEEVSPTSPYAVKGMWETRAAIVPKLTAADQARQFLVGRIQRGAQKAQREKGMTDESVRQEHAAWIDRGKNGPEPKSLWFLEDVTDMAPVMAWYEAHKDQIAR